MTGTPPNFITLPPEIHHIIGTELIYNPPTPQICQGLLALLATSNLVRNTYLTPIQNYFTFWLYVIIHGEKVLRTGAWNPEDRSKIVDQSDTASEARGGAVPSVVSYWIGLEFEEEEEEEDRGSFVNRVVDVIGGGGLVWESEIQGEREYQAGKGGGWEGAVEDVEDVYEKAGLLYGGRRYMATWKNFNGTYRRGSGGIRFVREAEKQYWTPRGFMDVMLDRTVVLPDEFYRGLFEKIGMVEYGWNVRERVVTMLVAHVIKTRKIRMIHLLANIYATRLDFLNLPTIQWWYSKENREVFWSQRISFEVEKALARDDILVIATIIDGGIDLPRLEAKRGLTPLHQSCFFGAVHCTGYLLSHGASPNAVYLAGSQSPLNLAVRFLDNQFQNGYDHPLNIPLSLSRIPHKQACVRLLLSSLSPAERSSLIFRISRCQSGLLGRFCHHRPSPNTTHSHSRPYCHHYLKMTTFLSRLYGRHTFGTSTTYIPEHLSFCPFTPLERLQYLAPHESTAGPESQLALHGGILKDDIARVLISMVLTADNTSDLDADLIHRLVKYGASPFTPVKLPLPAPEDMWSAIMIAVALDKRNVALALLGDEMLVRGWYEDDLVWERSGCAVKRVRALAGLGNVMRGLARRTAKERGVLGDGKGGRLIDFWRT